MGWHVLAAILADIPKRVELAMKSDQTGRVVAHGIVFEYAARNRCGKDRMGVDDGCVRSASG